MEHLDHFDQDDQNDPIQENYRPILLFQLRPDILPVIRWQVNIVPFLTSQLTLVCLSSNNTEHLRSGCHLSEDGVLNLPACVVGVFHVGKDPFKHKSAVKSMHFGLYLYADPVYMFVCFFNPPLPRQSTGSTVSPELQQTPGWPPTLCVS